MHYSHLVVTNKQWNIPPKDDASTHRLERFIIEVALANPDIAFKVSPFPNKLTCHLDADDISKLLIEFKH